MAGTPTTISLNVQRLFALLIILSLAGVSIWLVKPFLGAVVWGAIIAISLFPLHRHLTARLGGWKVVAATFQGLVLAGVLLVPLVMLLTTVGEQASRLVQAAPDVQHMEIPPAPDWLRDVPLIGRRASEIWQKAAADVPGTIETIRPKLREATIWLLSRTVASTLIVLEVILTIAFAVTFLITADRLSAFCVRLLARLGATDAADMQSLIVKTIRGVSQGIIGTAFIQATVAWIGLAIAGAPLPVLLSLVTFIACTVQVGALIVGAPVAAWMWYQGDENWAIFVLAWMLFVNIIDNFLKPILIGRGLPVPIWVVFIGVIGGLLAMGLVGLFIGPVILSVSYLLMMRWVSEAG